MRIRCWHDPKRRRVYFDFDNGHGETYAYPRQLSRDQVLATVNELIAEKHWQEVTINRGTFPEKPSELEPGTIADESEWREYAGGEKHVYGIFGVRYDTDLLGGW